MTVYGGIEAGGSKWECAVGTGPHDLRATETIRTTSAEETIGRTVAFFEREGPVDAIGIGSRCRGRSGDQASVHDAATPCPRARFHYARLDRSGLVPALPERTPEKVTPVEV